MKRPGYFALHSLCGANPDPKFVEEAHRGSIRRGFGTKRRGLRRRLGGSSIGRSCGSNRFRLGGPAPFQLPCFHFAPKRGTVLDDQSVGFHFTGNLAGAADLQSISRDNFPLDLAADNDFAGIEVGLHVSVRPNRQAAVRGEVQFSFHAAINEEVFGPRYFAFDSDSLTDACRNFGGT